MEIKLCEKEQCTGCGACVAKCPLSCIKFSLDDLDNVYPEIDMDKCVKCGSCVNACPSIKENQLVLNSPINAYAAWNKNSEIRRKSASGGAAAGLYQYAYEKGYVCYGVCWENGSLVYRAALKDEKPWELFQNSKYAFVDTSKKFKEIDNLLKSGQEVLCIGLPCQIAGLKKYIGKSYDNLMAVDLICHGNCSDIYLHQHISEIENITKQKTKKIHFRNPDFETEKFHFTLENDAGIFWNKVVQEDDEYQIGYHKAITYRENCYACKYATSKRCSDIMLGDYWLLGINVPFNYSTKEVSLIYTCTENGERYLKNTENYLEFHERPIQESIKAQGQLNHPSMKTKQHYVFIAEYRKTHNFDRAMRKAVWLDICCNKLGFSNQLIFVRKVMNKVRKVAIR